MPDDDFMDKALTRDEGTIRDMFSRAAPRYDFLNHLLSFNLDRSWRRAIVNQSRFREYGDDVRILDLCTGTGDVALEFARNPHFKGKAVGLDFSPQMLSIASKKAIKYGVSERVEFIDGNALKIPFSDETFHVITIAWGLRNLSDINRGVSEIYRVLKKGGRFLSLEFFKSDADFKNPLSSFYINHIVPFIGGIFSGSGAYKYLAASRDTFITADDFSGKMESVGLRNVSFRHFLFRVNTLHYGEKAP